MHNENRFLDTFRGHNTRPNQPPLGVEASKRRAREYIYNQNSICNQTSQNKYSNH